MAALANSTAAASLHSISPGACEIAPRSPSLSGPQRCRIPHIDGFREAAVLQFRPRQSLRCSERKKFSCRSAIDVNTKPAVNAKQSKAKPRGGPLRVRSIVLLGKFGSAFGSVLSKLARRIEY